MIYALFYGIVVLGFSIVAAALLLSNRNLRK